MNLTRDQLLADAALAFDQHGEVRVRDALDAVAKQPHRLARPDQRRRAVPLDQRQWRRRVGEPLGFEQHAGDAGRRLEQLAGPVIRPGARVEGRLEHHLPALLLHRHDEGDVVRRPNRLQRARRHRAGDLLQSDAAHARELREPLRQKQRQVAPVGRVDQSPRRPAAATDRDRHDDRRGAVAASWRA